MEELLNNEPIPISADGEKVDGGRGVGFDLFSESEDEVVHGAGARVSVVAPDLVEEFFTTDGLAFRFNEDLKHADFFFGKILGFSIAGEVSFRKVNFTGPDLIGVGDWLGALESPQEGMHAGEELFHAEGFCEVVIGSAVKAADPVVDLVFRSEHEDGDLVAMLAQGFAEGEAIELGHHDIEQD